MENILSFRHHFINNQSRGTAATLQFNLGVVFAAGVQDVRVALVITWWVSLTNQLSAVFFTPPGCDQIESTAPSEASCAVPFSGNTGSDVYLFAGRHNDVCLLTSVVIFTQRRNYSWQCEMQSVKTFVNFWNDVDRSGAFRSCLVCWVSFYFQRRGSCLN